MKHIRRKLLHVTALVAAFFVLPTTVAFAGAPQFDNGQQINTTDPYQNVQKIDSVYNSFVLYGKLAGATPVDIYQFTPDRDGEQTFSLIGADTASASAQPALVFVDPTDASVSAGNIIPLPSEDYHATVVKAIDGQQFYSEPLLAQRFTLYAQEHYKLAKDKTYYLVILDQSGQTNRYGLKFGDGTAWTAKDVFTSFGSWVRIKTDSYGGTTPFTFTPMTLGMLFLILGFAALFGIWLVEQIFAFLANRLKMAGYLLIKLQPYSRLFIWISLWFTLLGAYIYFNKAGWIGLPIIIATLLVILTILQLVYTFTLSRRLGVLEVAKQEATIPTGLQKWLYAYFAATLLTFAGLAAFLSMYFAR